MVISDSFFGICFYPWMKLHLKEVNSIFNINLNLQSSTEIELAAKCIDIYCNNQSFKKFNTESFQTLNDDGLVTTISGLIIVFKRDEYEAAMCVT